MASTWIGWTQILQLLDQYPVQLQTKGGMTQAFWTTVILTSNNHWKDWYPNYNGGRDLEALARRITKTFCFTGNRKDKNYHVYEEDEDGNKKEIELKELIKEVTTITTSSTTTTTTTTTTSSQAEEDNEVDLMTVSKEDSDEEDSAEEKSIEL